MHYLKAMLWNAGCTLRQKVTGLEGPAYGNVCAQVVPEYEFEIRFFLKREEVPLCAIGVVTPGAPRLGWSTWLKTPAVVHAQDPYITFEETDL
jgi:type VI secretion system protein ImpH